jgi:ADP-ribose pyrophosphatase
MKPCFTRADVKLKDRQCVYQGHFRLERLKVQYKLFAGGWSQPFIREVFERGEAVAILLFDPQRDALVLIEQFRVGIVNKTETPWIIEIVAGVIDTKESPEQVARRETQEETGLALQNLFFIGRHWVSPGGSTERISLFCGHVDASKAHGFHGLAKEGEDIRLHVLKTKVAYHLVNTGKFDNATTIIALLWLQQNEEIVRKAWKIK